MACVFGFLSHERQEALPGLTSTPGYMVLREHGLRGSKAFEIIPVSYDHSFQRAALHALGAPLFTIQG